MPETAARLPTSVPRCGRRDNQHNTRAPSSGYDCAFSTTARVSRWSTCPPRASGQTNVAGIWQDPPRSIALKAGRPSSSSSGCSSSKDSGFGSIQCLPAHLAAPVDAIGHRQMPVSSPQLCTRMRYPPGGAAPRRLPRSASGRAGIRQTARADRVAGRRRRSSRCSQGCPARRCSQTSPPQESATSSR